MSQQHKYWARYYWNAKMCSL